MENESTRTFKTNMNDRLRRSRERIDEFTAESKAKARRAVRITNNYAHDHPWRMVATGSALAFIAGMLVRGGRQRPRKVVINREVKPIVKVKAPAPKKSGFEMIHALIPLVALGLKAMAMAQSNTKKTAHHGV